MKNFKTGTLIAIAAGGLFVSACKKDEKATVQKEETPQAAPAPEVKPEEKPAMQPGSAEAEKVSKIDCAGVNACKGQGTCKTETNGCGGQNACKGKGVLTMTEEECKAKGGTVAVNK
ncbi:MAG TPA: hypothetical protein VIV11_42920 [Kofleriaceae bacterium]